MAEIHAKKLFQTRLERECENKVSKILGTPKIEENIYQNTVIKFALIVFYVFIANLLSQTKILQIAIPYMGKYVFEKILKVTKAYVLVT